MLIFLVIRIVISNFALVFFPQRKDGINANIFNKYKI